MGFIERLQNRLLLKAAGFAYLKKEEIRNDPSNLQSAGGNDPIALRQFQIRGIFAEVPGELAGPLLCHSGEVQQGDTLAQPAVQLGGVGIGSSHQRNAAAAEYKAVGLAV